MERRHRDGRLMGIFGDNAMTQPPAAPDFWTLEKINDDVRHEWAHRPDCQWQTFFKGKKLREMGFAPQDVYVRTKDADPSKPGPNHVVLRMGDWVLDNLQKRPYKYSAMVRQYQEFPGYEIVPGTKLANNSNCVKGSR